MFLLSIWAFTGALLSIVLVYLLAKNKYGVLPIRLILTGVAVSSLFSAVTNYLIFNAENESGIRNAIFWIMGENTANVLGIDVNKIRNIIMLISALLTGYIVSVSGLIGSDHRKVIPISALFGAIFIVWIDVLIQL